LAVPQIQLHVDKMYSLPHWYFICDIITMTEHDMFASVISLRPDFEANANDVSALVKSLLAANPYSLSLL